MEHFYTVPDKYFKWTCLIQNVFTTLFRKFVLHLLYTYRQTMFTLKFLNWTKPNKSKVHMVLSVKWVSGLNMLYTSLYITFQSRFCLFIFREKGREGVREGEKHQCVVASHTALTGIWPATQACALTGNQTGDPFVHSLHSTQSYTSQGYTSLFHFDRRLSISILLYIPTYGM